MRNAFLSFLLEAVEWLTGKGYALLIGVAIALILYGAVGRRKPVLARRIVRGGTMCLSGCANRQETARPRR